MIKRCNYLALALFITRVGLLTSLIISSELSPVASYGIVPLLFLDIMFFTGREFEKYTDDDLATTQKMEFRKTAEYFNSPKVVAELEASVFDETELNRAA